MLSFIFNSDTNVATKAVPASSSLAVRKATIVLLGTVLAILCVTELSSRFLFPRISTLQRRITKDRHEVMTIGQPNPNRLPIVLLAGNSLLLHGVDYPRLRDATRDRAQIFRYAIENTEYIDWYYGLRRLFAEGVRPSTVFLCLNLGQTISYSVLDQSSRYLVQTSDLLNASRDARMDTTQASGFVIAHWSDFYANRATIRNYIINKSDPAYASALHALARHPPTFPSESAVTAQTRGRMAALRDLCRQNGSELVLLIPPSLGQGNDLLRRAALMENIKVEIPATEVALTAAFFQPDRFHLNEQGQKLFTDALLHDLQVEFPQSSTTDPQ